MYLHHNLIYIYFMIVVLYSWHRKKTSTSQVLVLDPVPTLYFVLHQFSDLSGLDC